MPPFSDITWIILFGALATYATRIGGHLVLSRFERIPRRVPAALDAVPAAVLTTLIVPTIVTNGPAETFTLIIVGIAALRLPLIAVLALGAVVIVMLRSAGIG